MACGTVTQAVYQRMPPSFIIMPCCLSGNRNRYLAKIDRQTQERLDTIIQQMARAQNITEVLKATDQMTWVGRMNSI